jgi:hypothetical protein
MIRRAGSILRREWFTFLLLEDHETKREKWSKVLVLDGAVLEASSGSMRNPGETCSLKHSIDIARELFDTDD